MIWYIFAAVWLLSAIVCRWYVRKDIELRERCDFRSGITLFTTLFPVINIFAMIAFFIIGVGWDGEYSLGNLFINTKEYLFRKLIYDYENEENS